MISCWNLSIYEGQLKRSCTDQDTLMECDQIRFDFQYSNPCAGPYTSSTGVAVLGSHLLKSTADVTWYELFSSPSNLCTLLRIYFSIFIMYVGLFIFTYVSIYIYIFHRLFTFKSIHSIYLSIDLILFIFIYIYYLYKSVHIYWFIFLNLFTSIYLSNQIFSYSLSV